jgi:hypothetical protein
LQARRKTEALKSGFQVNTSAFPSRYEEFVREKQKGSKTKKNSSSELLISAEVG